MIGIWNRNWIWIQQQRGFRSGLSDFGSEALFYHTQKKICLLPNCRPSRYQPYTLSE
jgi:hypothetical protein